VVGLCEAFLWLFGICALAVSERAKLAITIKTLRFITPSVSTSLIKPQSSGEVAPRPKLMLRNERQGCAVKEHFVGQALRLAATDAVALQAKVENES
jgi:hypothetical protein